MACTFSLTNADSSKSANISHTIHIMTVARGPPTRVVDVEHESAIYYLHPEGESSLQSTFTNKTVGIPPASQMWNIKFRMCSLQKQQIRTNSA